VCVCVCVCVCVHCPDCEYSNLIQSIGCVCVCVSVCVCVGVGVPRVSISQYWDT